MLTTLGDPDCSEEAAAFVGAEVIAALAMNRLIPQQLDLLLSSVLAAIFDGRDTNQVLLMFRIEIAARLKLAPFQRAQILQAVGIYMRI